MDDTGQDGLDFFANNDGTGFFQIRKLTSAPLAGLNQILAETSFITLLLVTD